MTRELRGRKPDTINESKAKILLFGPPGVGKTYFAIAWPGVYYFDCEGGANREQYRKRLADAGAAYFGVDDGSQDFATVIDEVITLASVKHDFKTVVFDSYSKLFATCAGDSEEQLLAQGKKVEFGAEKKAAIRASRKLIRWLDKLDMNVILICHEKPLWQNGEQIGETYDAWDKMGYELDLVCQAQRRGKDNRVLIVRKSRILDFPEGGVFPLDYEEFASIYGKSTIESESTALELATPEQVAELEHLLIETVTPLSTQEQWKHKAQVDSWHEMPSESIGRCIEWLKQKVEA